MEDFRDSTAVAGDGNELRARLDEDSYLFVRGVVDAAEIAAVRADVTAVLERAGWLAEGSDPLEARPSAAAQREVGEASYLDTYRHVLALQSFNELAHASGLVELVGRVLGDDVLVHPRKIARASLPKDYGFETPPHQDYRLIQGTADVLTVWVPLGDVPRDRGALAVQRGSHRSGVREVMGALGPGGLTLDPPVTTDEPGWCTTDFGAGDVVVFHSFTVHTALPNHGDSLRLSCDFRYQSLREPVLRASLLPHYWPMIDDWPALTGGWTSTASIDAPAGVVVVEPFEHMRPGVPTPPSRLVGVDGVPA